jgi:hypothetical protein
VHINSKLDNDMLNWHKFEMLGKQLALIPRYQRLSYNEKPLPGFLAVFEGTELLDECQVWCCGGVVSVRVRVRVCVCVCVCV